MEARHFRTDSKTCQVKQDFNIICRFDEAMHMHNIDEEKVPSFIRRVRISDFPATSTASHLSPKYNRTDEEGEDLTAGRR